MALFADFTRDDRAGYFRVHGGDLIRARADLVAVLERFASVANACGAWEGPMTPERAVSRWLTSIDNDLAEEVVDYIGAG
jgi:hypothetical protein